MNKKKPVLILVVVALIVGGVVLTLARTRNDADARREREAKQATTAGAALAMGTTTSSAPVPAPTEEGSAPRPTTSAKPNAGTAATGATLATARASASAASSSLAVPVAAIAPPPTGGKPYGGPSGFHAGGNFGDCPTCDWEAWNTVLDAKGSQISACYKASEFEPPRHEYPEYLVHVNADGKFAAIDALSEKTPNLDACLGAVIRSVPLSKPSGGPGTFHVSFTGRCKTFECQ